MKIRTDFVTNSSSSSFVIARICTTSKELLDAMDVVRQNYYMESGEYIRIDKNKTIEIEMNEEAFGFNYHYPNTPSDVIEVLLDAISQNGDAKQLSKLKKNKKQLVNSITEYEIEVGETGNSENESIWEDYREYISHYYEDEDELDTVMEEAIRTGEWATRITTFSLKPGSKTATSQMSMSGPADEM